jgi:hypothetical protein
VFVHVAFGFSNEEERSSIGADECALIQICGSSRLSGATIGGKG